MAEVEFPKEMVAFATLINNQKHDNNILIE